jgi:hypothetical protein
LEVSAVPGLDGSFIAIWTGRFFPYLLAVPLDFLVERLLTQEYWCKLNKLM